MIVAGSLHGPGPIVFRARTRNQVSLPRSQFRKFKEREFGKVKISLQGPLSWSSAFWPS
jgi:hypothetical protein